MLAREYIEKALQSCERALGDLDNGELLKTLGDLDFVEDRIKAAKILIELELKEEENGQR